MENLQCGSQNHHVCHIKLDLDSAEQLLYLVSQ